MTEKSDNGFVEIKLLEKLSENTDVVTKGAFFILSEMKKGEAGTAIKFILVLCQQ